MDFIQQAMRRGEGLRSAIISAGQKRFRPIIMTTLTTILGLFPMIIGFGDGVELRRPLAVAVIFGLGFATVLTLVVIPVVFQQIVRRD